MKLKMLCAGSVIAAALLGCNNDTNPGASATGPAPATLPGVGGMKDQADKVMGEVEAAINDKKWDAADAGMAQLQKLKPSLPAELAGKVDALQKKLDDAKKAAPPAK
jgi:hypothetical protein